MRKSFLVFITISFFIFLGFLCFAKASLAATYYVSPSGTASWASCTNIDTPCSLATANTNVSAGDTAYLRGGTYNTHIFPARSGTDVSNRITYAAYSAETPIIKNTTTTYATYYFALALIGRSYIKIDGITFGPEPTHQRLMSINKAASHNEVTNSIFDGGGKSPAVQMWKGNLALGDEYASTNHWIHRNTFKNFGEVSSGCDDWGGMQIGVPAYDKVSGNHTIENNIFYGGGHHNLETFTKNNVIRNNYFHNEPSMVAPNPPCPYSTQNNTYGNRNIQVYDGYSEDKWNLIEGNRFGHSGQPPDDDGGDGFTLTAPRNIVRYNAIFNSQNNGVLFKSGYNSLADNNRFFNNTIYKSGVTQNTPQWQGWNFRWYGSYARVGNVIKNNIIYSYGTGGADWGGGSGTIYTDNTVINNFCTNAQAGRCSANGNPLFVNTDVSDPFSSTLPNLNLQSNSPAIDGGTYLTQANGSGSNSTTLIVNDALYFQDGTWGSSLAGHVADWIAIGTVGNIVQISSINYVTNTITLASAMTWSNGANIWLYKKSDGVQVLYGSAPDYGAYEYVETGDTTPPASPTGLIVI